MKKILLLVFTVLSIAIADKTYAFDHGRHHERWEHRGYGRDHGRDRGHNYNRERWHRRGHEHMEQRHGGFDHRY